MPKYQLDFILKTLCAFKILIDIINKNDLFDNRLLNNKKSKWYEKV